MSAVAHLTENKVETATYPGFGHLYPAEAVGLWKASSFSSERPVLASLDVLV